MAINEELVGTNELGIPPQLANHAKLRTDEFVRKLTDAMKLIELEIDSNDQLYPFNGGNLNQAELCRRAGVRNVSLQGKAHKTTTKVMVDEWIAKMTAKMVTGSRRVRRAVTERADYWKEAHRKIADTVHLNVILLETEKTRNRKLEDENQRLREHLAKMSDGKIVALPKKK